MPVDHGFVLSRGIGKGHLRSQKLLKILLCVGKSGIAHLLIKVQIIADPPSVHKHKTPEGHRGSPPGPLADADGPVLPGIRLLKFQKQIAGRFLPAFLPQKIIFHLPVAGAKGVQTAGGPVPVQNKRNKALGRNRLSRAILSPKQKLPVLKCKCFLII